MPVKVLADLRHRLDLLARKTSPLSIPPPRSTRFGSPLVLSRVHWVEPKLVAEITYLTWTADNLLRHTVYVGLREDKSGRPSAARSRTGLISRNEHQLHQPASSPESTYCGRSRPRPWTPQLGGKRTYRGRQRRRAKATVPQIVKESSASPRGRAGRPPLPAYCH